MLKKIKKRPYKKEGYKKRFATPATKNVLKYI